MTAIEELTVEEFTAECRAFLDAHAEPKAAARRFVWGEGDDAVATFEEVDPAEEARQLAAAKEWRATRYDAGFGWIAGPPELGGRGLPPSYGRAYDSLEARYQTPPGVLLRHRARDGRPDDPRPRHRAREAGVPPGHVPRRHRRLPAVQRAGRGLRPGGPPDPGRARRRRVGDHGSEGLDVRRAVQRHRRDHLPHRSRPAEAPRASPASSWTCGRPASRCGRCAR